VLEAVNRIRRSHGLGTVLYEPRLFDAAREHSREQERHGYMGHGSPDPRRQTVTQRVNQAGYVGVIYAEVVAWGYDRVDAVVEGWMNSRDHRAILLDPDLRHGAFSRVGAYWTGNFATPASSALPFSDTRRAPAPAAPPRRWEDGLSDAPLPLPELRWPTDAHQPAPAPRPYVSAAPADPVEPAPAPCAPPVAIPDFSRARTLPPPAMAPCAPPGRATCPAPGRCSAEGG
jgi:hypothetical protein